MQLDKVDKDDINFIKDLISTKLFNARNRLERIKISSKDSDMIEEINLDITYMSELIKKLEEYEYKLSNNKQNKKFRNTKGT